MSSIRSIEAGVPQGSVLGPILYLLFTHDIPTMDGVLTGTFADDTAILTSSSNPAAASATLQISIDQISNWLKIWRLKANETKSCHVTFTTRRGTCPEVRVNNKAIPQSDSTKYLGVHLDRRLTWRPHIFAKRKSIGITVRNMHSLLGKQSSLSLENKILIYKSVLKPVWTYGIQLWGTTSNSNIEILQRFQSKLLRVISKAPWYMTNKQIHQELNIPFVKLEIIKNTTHYKERLQCHPNELASTLMSPSHIFKRLKRKTTLQTIM
jgi:hypothetical protein